MSDLIRREDVFKAIVGLTTHKTVDDIEIFCEDSVAGSEGWLGGIRDALREVEYIPSAEPERKWIPVTEALPENNDEVLTTYIVNGNNRKRFVETASYIDGDEGYWSSPWDEYMVRGTRKDVLAWMPLPEVWRGE